MMTMAESLALGHAVLVTLWNVVGLLSITRQPDVTG
jgi:hypothetical protein